uniref:Sulfurtransferase TusA family protein n=1 Tax=Ignisphaera aggregans TaxID=334771 RepID=A0A7C2ZMY4_9CREN
MPLVLDLTGENVTCVEHPIVKVVKTLNEIQESEVVVIVSKDDIPSVKILEMIAEKMKFRITEVSEDNNVIKAKLVRETSK